MYTPLNGHSPGNLEYLVILSGRLNGILKQVLHSWMLFWVPTSVYTRAVPNSNLKYSVQKRIIAIVFG